MNKDSLIDEINGVVKKYCNYFAKDLCENDVIYTKHILMSTVLQKSVAIIEAFKDALLKNNIIIINSLIRMQIDNCIFIYRTYLINTELDYSTNKIYKSLIKGKRLDALKINNQTLNDRYIVSEIDKYCSGDFKGLYDFSCGHIHFSSSANNLAVDLKKESTLIINISNDYSKFENDSLISGKSMIECSKLILILINKFWKDIDLGSCLT